MFFVRRSLWQRTVGESIWERCLLSDSISSNKVSELGTSCTSAELQEVKLLKLLFYDGKGKSVTPAFLGIFHEWRMSLTHSCTRQVGTVATQVHQPKSLKVVWCFTPKAAKTASAFSFSRWSWKIHLLPVREPIKYISSLWDLLIYDGVWQHCGVLSAQIWGGGRMR